LHKYSNQQGDVQMIDSQVSSVSIMQASQVDDCYQAALAYQKLNLSVLPLNGKRPVLAAWSEYQFAPAKIEAIHSWQRDGFFGNVGIICGKVSDNLVVLDFDGAGGYPAFVAMFPQLAETFTVATGGGVQCDGRADRVWNCARGVIREIAASGTDVSQRQSQGGSSWAGHPGRNHRGFGWKALPDTRTNYSQGNRVHSSSRKRTLASASDTWRAAAQVSCLRRTRFTGGA
jgi:hypothetical protein